LLRPRAEGSTYFRNSHTLSPANVTLTE